MTNAFDHAEVWLNAAYRDVEDLIDEVKKLDSNHPLLKKDGQSLVSLKEKINDVVVNVRTFMT